MKLLTVALQSSFSSGTQAPLRYLTVTHSACAAVETQTSSAGDSDPLEIIYGARGDTIIVNGVVAPLAKVPLGLIRRLLNAANAQNSSFEKSGT